MRDQKTYFLLNSTDYAPGPSSLIRLGQIIPSLKEPHRGLSPPQQPLPPIHYAWKSDFTFEREAKICGSLGLCGTFLAQLSSPVSGSGAGTLSRKDTVTWNVRKLETEFIEPDATYVCNSVMGVDAVKDFFEKNKRLGLTKSAYMVIGVKVARGASFAHKKTRGIKAEGEMILDPTMLTGAPFQVGPKGSIEKETNEGETFKDCSDFVFAYRLRKIFVQWRSKQLDSKEVIGGDLAGVDDEVNSDEDESDEDRDEPTEIDTVMLESWDFGSDFKPSKFEALVVEDEWDSEECQVLIPEDIYSSVAAN